MLIPKRNDLPRVVNTSERKILVDKKGSVTSKFWSCHLLLKKNIDRLAKGKDGKGRIFNYRKRMALRKHSFNLLQRMGLYCSDIRRVEAELNEYDELQRLKYMRIKR